MRPPICRAGRRPVEGINALPSGSACSSWPLSAMRTLLSASAPVKPSRSAHAQHDVKLRALRLRGVTRDLQRIDALLEQRLQRPRGNRIRAAREVHRALAGISADLARITNQIAAGDLEPPFADVSALEAAKLLHELRRCRRAKWPDPTVTVEGGDGCALLRRRERRLGFRTGQRHRFHVANRRRQPWQRRDLHGPPFHMAKEGWLSAVHVERAPTSRVRILPSSSLCWGVDG